MFVDVLGKLYLLQPQKSSINQAVWLHMSALEAFLIKNYILHPKPLMD